MLLVDTDPQCNTTINIIPKEEFEKIYYDKKEYTIYNWINPLVEGVGYAENLSAYYSEKFEFILMIGDPRRAFLEDFLGTDLNSIFSGQTRSIMTILVFKELLKRCEKYDIVFFGMEPLLGAINRFILHACDYFIILITPDIFNVLVMKNIGKMIVEWGSKFEQGLDAVD